MAMAHPPTSLLGTLALMLLLSVACHVASAKKLALQLLPASAQCPAPNKFAAYGGGFVMGPSDLTLYTVLYGFNYSTYQEGPRSSLLALVSSLTAMNQEKSAYRWWGIFNNYCDFNGDSLSLSVWPAITIYNNTYDPRRTLSALNIQQIIQRSFDLATTPEDGFFLVITHPRVKIAKNLGCYGHSAFNAWGVAYPFGFVSGQNKCTTRDVKRSEANPVIASVSRNIFRTLAEGAIDPLGDGWYHPVPKSKKRGGLASSCPIKKGYGLVTNKIAEKRFQFQVPSAYDLANRRCS